MALTAADASWKTPRILRTALTAWASRDDTRPDPKARAAADDALTAVDAMVAELLALRSRVTAEIAAADFSATMREDFERLQPADAEAPAPAPAPDPESPEHVAVRPLVAPLYAVPDTYRPAVQVPYAGVLDDASIAAIQSGSAGVRADELPEIRKGILSLAADHGLASCGHQADEDGDCGCSYWPERAPLVSSH